MFSTTTLKKALASLASVAILSTSAGQAIAAGGFVDTEGTDYSDAFAYLKTHQIVQGYADGLARPGYPLNRVEALKVILEAEGSFADRIAFYKAKTPSLPLFTDVDQTQWYTAYLESGFEKGVITGYPDGSFRPGQLLRTEEAITMLMRTFGMENQAQTALLSNYIENRQGEWFTPSINASIDKNLIMNKGKLRLGAAITRGQFFDIVYRLHSITATGGTTFAGREPGSVTPVTATTPSSTHGTGVATYDSSDQPAPAPVASSSSRVSEGVVQFQTPSVPENVQLAPRIDHPHASEKYFAISMPSLGIEELTITHPTDAVTKKGVLSVLQQGVGHLFSYPGGEGKIMIYGHSSGYPWDVSQYTKIFRRINELEIGDRVYVTYAGKLHIYEVSREQTINAKDANKAFLDEGVGEELILFTCWPPDSIAQRYLVHAVPVETVALQ